MRYAALDLPDLALQLALRNRGLRQDSLAAVAAPVGGRELVVAVTRAAREAGARPGQTVAQAKALAPALEALPAAFERAGETLGALAEALGALSPAVELSPPEALLLDASASRFLSREAPAAPGGPAREQELLWAEAVLSVARGFGLAGRVAVADTPLAARLVAASLTEPVRAVPSAHQLSAVSGISWRLVEALVSATALQLPRMALPEAGPPLWPTVSGESFRLLEELGIRRLGRLIEFPPATLVERLGKEGESLLALARAGRPRPLLAHRAPEALVESVEFEPGIELASALVFALRPAAERLAARLSGRGVAATRLVLHLETEVRDDEGVGGPPRPSAPAPAPAGTEATGRGVPMLPRPRRRQETVTLAFARPTTQARLIIDVLRDRLESWQGVAPILFARLEVAETGARRDQLALGERPRTMEGVESVLARLRSRLGDDAVGSPVPVPDHLPERASGVAAFRPAAAAWATRRASAESAPEEPPDGREGPFAGLSAVPLRQWAPEEAIAEQDPVGGLRAFVWRGQRHRVLARTAPDRLSTHWWTGTVVRDYQTVLLADGARLWVFQDPHGRWWVQGVHD